MYSFSVKSLNLLNNPKLHPSLRTLMLEAIKDSPIDFTIIETVRTMEKQKEYFKAKATRTLKSRHIPQTNASGFGEAVDIAPYPINWKDTKRFADLAAHIKRKAKELNIKINWGGDWKTFIDMPHYELTK